MFAAEQADLESAVTPGKKYPIIEVFGPTMQGEGAMAGVFTYFIRFGGCDYRCLWCDTSYAVLPAQVRENTTKLTTDEIVDRLRELPEGPRWVTLSGGNPALLDLKPLVDELHRLGYRIAVETQGSAYKDWLAYVDQLTISVKPPSSGMLGKIDSSLEMMVRSLTGINDINLKVPVFDDRDYEWAVKLHEQFPNLPFYFSIVTRMGGLYGDFDGGAIDTNDDILRRYKWLVERASRDVRVSDARAFPQLHALVWGHGRGF